MLGGPQIKPLLKDHRFVAAMTAVEVRAWNTFSTIVNKYLGNMKADNYTKEREVLLVSL